MSTPLLESEELDATQVKIFTSDLDASSLAETHIVSNPSTLTSDHDSVVVSSDASSEPTSIEYVRANYQRGVSAHRSVWVN